MCVPRTLRKPREDVLLQNEGKCRFTRGRGNHGTQEVGHPTPEGEGEALTVKGSRMAAVQWA